MTSELAHVEVTIAQVAVATSTALWLWGVDADAIVRLYEDGSLKPMQDGVVVPTIARGSNPITQPMLRRLYRQALQPASDEPSTRRRRVMFTFPPHPRGL